MILALVAQVKNLKNAVVPYNIKAKKATSATTIPLIIKILFLDFIIS